MDPVWFGPPPSALHGPGPFVSVVVDDPIVVVDSPDRTWPLNRRWLRDNCRCHECRIEQTGERRFLPGDDVLDQPVVRADIIEGVLQVDWASGHRSRFTHEQLLAIDHESRRGGWRPLLWSGDHRPERFAHDGLGVDADATIAALETFRNHGVVVITGLPSTPGEVEAFLGRLGVPLREMPFDRIHDVLVDPAGYNVSHTAEAVPPHADFPSYGCPPSGQLLHMLRDDADGGDSIVVDGWAVAAAIGAESPERLDVLSRVEVPFRQFSAGCETFARSPLVRRDPNGQINGFRFSNQLMQALPFDHPDLGAFYEAYEDLAARLLDPANQVRFRLRAGEMLMVHGHRVLHARTGFAPATGHRHLQDTYFDFDDVLAVLARHNGEARTATSG